MPGRYPLFAVWLVLALACWGATSGTDATHLVLMETSLRPSPDSEEIEAFLAVGTPLNVLERRDDWVKVQIEGWVRAESVDPTSLAAPDGAAGGVTVEGLIRIEQSRLQTTAAGASIVVLPFSIELEGADAGTDTAKRLAALEAEAERLENEAARAMRMDNFTEAMRKRDRLVEEREAVLAQRRDLLAVRHGRHEHAARNVAVASSVTDSRGWYSVAVPPGRYTLYARFARDDLDLEWIEPLTVGREPVHIDLNETNARGMLPKSK